MQKSRSMAIFLIVLSVLIVTLLATQYPGGNEGASVSVVSEEAVSNSASGEPVSAEINSPFGAMPEGNTPAEGTGGAPVPENSMEDGVPAGAMVPADNGEQSDEPGASGEAPQGQ